MRSSPSPPGTVTPEAVELELEYATVGSRGIAYLLDLLIIGLLFVLIAVAEGTFGVSGFVPGWLGLALLLLLAFAVQFGYPIGFETLWRGRTPGKAAMGLRVVTVEGAPVGLRHAALRAVVGLFELLPTLGVPAMISSLVGARGQRLGDLAAGTVVLRERRGSRAPAPQQFAAPPGLEGYVAHLDVSRLGPADYAAVRDTLLRLHELTPAARRHVAETVADGLLGRVAPAPPSGVPAEVWLACVAAAVQARRSPGPRPTAPARPAGGPAGPAGGGGWAAPPREAGSDTPPASRAGEAVDPPRPAGEAQNRPGTDTGFQPPA
ncbi:RDD family protein [Egicoccus sp. AB-alg2]|uniref:RDD family protein n=1 Tax=Egicoccus sp. AB-alg2 TaxID=3242693 RepID=UPI00359EECA0